MSNTITPTKKNLPKGFAFLLASLTAISPFAIDAYLPAIVSISQYYQTALSNVELTLTLYLIGLSIGQLIGGPLSDRYGRKLMINFGLLVYILFSILITYATSIDQFWFYRFMQAVGGGFAVVNMGAIVRDNFKGQQSAQVLSFVAMIMMIAPLIAPTVGALILEYFNWQYIFFFLASYAFLVLFWIQLLPETSPKTKDQNPLQDYWSVLSNPIAFFLAMTAAFSMSGMFIFIVKSSFIYMDYYALDKNLFTLFFAMNVAMLMIFNRFNIYLLNYFERKNLVLAGVLTQLTSAIILSINIIFNDANLIFTILFLMSFVGSLGMIFGNTISLVLEFFPKFSATANAVIGVLGFATSSVMGSIAAKLLTQDSLLSVFLFMAFTALLGLSVFAIAQIKIRAMNEN
jgi:DHA1 family bicyclomycin/chloramphenicol resistance-like MFS transporter